MKAKCSKTIRVTLALDEKEARWLMSYVQNPMCDLDDEDEETSKMRQSLFTALKRSLSAKT